MLKKTPVLKYESSMEDYQDSIVPSKKLVPDWYKKIPRWKNGVFFDMQTGTNPTLKQCIPFLDSLTLGYMITLPYDLYVEDNDGSPQIIVAPGVEYPPKIRNDVADLNIVPSGHYPVEFVWDYNVSYTFPKGYSAIFTHPFNRHDLPFTTITGVIDGGLVMTAHGNPPFYIKKDFKGLIPQGTPIVQLVPFRQENWKSKKTKGLVDIGKSHAKKTSLVFSGWYKKTFWVRKQYD
jgi:hypothetical protein